MEDFVTFDKFTPIPNFENYGINKCGDVCSFRKKKLLKQGQWGAYKSVALSKKRQNILFSCSSFGCNNFYSQP